MKKYLIVGLGNIGAEYVNTRHNIGFKIVDALAKQENLKFETMKYQDFNN
jgi:PTH1 family peptidyl-tRNA hydrolase